MIPSLRRRFNQSWSPDKYAQFFELLARQCGEGPQFRHSETPVFPARGTGRPHGALWPRDGGSTALESGVRARLTRSDSGGVSRATVKIRFRFLCRRISDWTRIWNQSWWRFRVSRRFTLTNWWSRMRIARLMELTPALRQFARWPHGRRVPRSAEASDCRRARSGNGGPARDRSGASKDAA